MNVIGQNSPKNIFLSVSSIPLHMIIVNAMHVKWSEASWLLCRTHNVRTPRRHSIRNADQALRSKNALNSRAAWCKYHWTWIDLAFDLMSVAICYVENIPSSTLSFVVFFIYFINSRNVSNVWQLATEIATKRRSSLILMLIWKQSMLHQIFILKLC